MSQLCTSIYMYRSTGETHFAYIDGYHTYVWLRQIQGTSTRTRKWWTLCPLYFQFIGQVVHCMFFVVMRGLMINMFVNEHSWLFICTTINLWLKHISSQRNDMIKNFIGRSELEVKNCNRVLSEVKLYRHSKNDCWWMYCKIDK